MMQRDWKKAIHEVSTLLEWDEVRVSLLGKSGYITQLLKSLGALPPEDRKTKGQEINALKDQVQEALNAKKAELESAVLKTRLELESIDVTLPARPRTKGSLHPISQTTRDICTHFANYGFTVAHGPDIEDDYYNFDALNIPAHHPARQNHDTFYFGDGHLLRTHTSPVQIRAMKKHGAPLAILAPGRVFRADYDATHSPMFHQMEGLFIAKDVHMGHLKATIIDFCESFFNVKNCPVRFRPSFFPFTEPSAEVDIGCKRTNNELVIGGGESWLEVLGCGLVHPKVLENGGIDPNKYSAFAFGMGIERFAMLKYGIPDIRGFFEGDIRWHQHFGQSAI